MIQLKFAELALNNNQSVTFFVSILEQDSGINLNKCATQLCKTTEILLRNSFNISCAKSVAGHQFLLVGQLLKFLFQGTQLATVAKMLSFVRVTDGILFYCIYLRNNLGSLQLDLQLSMQLLPITTDVVSLNLDQGEVYNIM